MSRCSCGGVEISCRKGCGCFCAGGADCTRWCEPVVVEAFDRESANDGGITRTLVAADGSTTMVINATAANGSADLPVHAPGTPLTGCLRGASLASLALVLGTLHGKSVQVSADRATQTVDAQVSGTLDEIAAQFGLTVA